MVNRELLQGAHSWMLAYFHGSLYSCLTDESQKQVVATMDKLRQALMSTGNEGAQT